MSQLGKFRDALALYRRHGWTLARVLMTPQTLGELRRESSGAASSSLESASPSLDGAGGEDARDSAEEPAPRFEQVEARESDFDAMWLSRPSAAGREAWELRLVADTPYALFELFEPDEPEEDREDVRREMEAKLRDYVGGGGEKVDEGNV